MIVINFLPIPNIKYGTLQMGKTKQNSVFLYLLALTINFIIIPKIKIRICITIQ